MKTILLFIQFLFFVAQSEESWKTIFNEFTGSNWDASGWFIYYSYGGPFSQCGNTKLFGGYSVFGQHSLISSKYTLPPHYSLRISFDFWNWDSEIMKIVFDSEIIQTSISLNLTEGQQICGVSNWNEFNIPFIISITQHKSQSLVVIMTSTLDQEAGDESWGFQNLKIEILECPQDCVFCTDQTSSCKFWILFASDWNGQITSEGWKINGLQQLTSSACVYMQIAGGYNILQKGQSIDKLLETLPPHFKVQILFKLWTIGEWQNELFSLVIDDEPIYSIPIVSDNFYFSQCQAQKVKITNIDVSSLHASTTIQLQMKTEKIINDLAYWGVQSFDFFVAKCSFGCIECTGQLNSQCITCLNKWKNIEIGCIPPPLECSQIRIIDLPYKKVDFMNSFKIQSDEITQNIGEIGQQTLILDELISFISFQIQVKCSEKLIIKSFFRNCDQCNEEQLKFSNQCLTESNFFTYHATFIQAIEYKKELIITISQSKLEIVQVASTDEAQREFLILKIEI